jgi:pimeloyl-ACP methyl ester carboxylesterase
MTHKIKSVDLANGVNIQYVEQGERAGIPVLFLHGVTDSWRSFEPVLPHLPASIHAYALSQRGHGDSSGPEAGYSFRDFASDVVGFMDALNIKGAVIVGHSMGSYVAQRFAMDHPERALGLVLIGSFATLRGNAGVEEFWDSAIKDLSDPVDPSLARDFQQSTLAQPVPAEFLEMVIAESMKVKARVWRATFEEFRVADYSGELGKIKAPTLIVWGDRDSFFLRNDQEALASGISNARLVVYSGAGHATHWEEPERFAGDLLTFIESLASKSNRAPGAR